MKQGGDEGDAWTSVDERKSGKYSDNELQNTNIVYYQYLMSVLTMLHISVHLVVN